MTSTDATLESLQWDPQSVAHIAEVDQSLIQLEGDGSLDMKKYVKSSQAPLKELPSNLVYDESRPDQPLFVYGWIVDLHALLREAKRTDSMQYIRAEFGSDSEEESKDPYWPNVSNTDGLTIDYFDILGDISHKIGSDRSDGLKMPECPVHCVRVHGEQRLGYAISSNHSPPIALPTQERTEYIRRIQKVMGFTEPPMWFMDYTEGLVPGPGDLGYEDLVDSRSPVVPRQ